MAKDLTTGIVPVPEGMRLATLRRGREAVEETCLPPDGAFAEALRALRLKGSVVLALPSDQMVMRVLDLPDVDSAEMAGMAELQADKFSPFPLEQMVVSHEVLARREGTAGVLVAAARIQVVGAVGKPLEDAGLRIARVDAALLGRWRALQETGQLEREGRETLVLADGGCVDVLTQEAGVPVALSGLGAVPDLGEPAVADDIAQEVAHLMMGLDAERGRTGKGTISVWMEDGAARAALAEALRRRTSREVRERTVASLGGVASGIVRRAQAEAGAPLLDLTPPAWREASASNRFKRRLGAVACGLLGGWLLLAVGGWSVMAYQRAQIESLRAAEQRWLEPANAVRRLRMQVNLINRYMDRRTSALECLREISLLQPPGVDLASFAYRKGEGLEITGEADTGALVIQFNERLNKSGLFGGVRAGPRTLTPRQRHRFSFEITFNGEGTP